MHLLYNANKNHLLWSLVRITLTLVIEFLIFFRQSASSSLDSRAHCTQVAGGCRYLHERWERTFKPQIKRKILKKSFCISKCFLEKNNNRICVSQLNIYEVICTYKRKIQTFHTACRSELWPAWGFPLRCLPEYAGRLHTCWLGWEV